MNDVELNMQKCKRRAGLKGVNRAIKNVENGKFTELGNEGMYREPKERLEMR